MSRFFAKAAFVHRRLWTTDGWYRAASMFGPPPLVGALLAVAVWQGFAAWHATAKPPPAWAKPLQAAEWTTSATNPPAVAPAAPLPAPGIDGIPLGYESGWTVTARPIEISPTMDVKVDATALTALKLRGVLIDWADMLTSGPADTLFVGVGFGALVVRTPGVYAVTARLMRPAGQSADCLVRLALGPRRIVSTVLLNLVDDVMSEFKTGYFDLQPGLYPLSWAFGCWHDHKVVGPGRMTIVIGHPGSGALQPARADEIVRPKHPA